MSQFSPATGALSTNEEPVSIADSRQLPSTQPMVHSGWSVEPTIIKSKVSTSRFRAVLVGFWNFLYIWTILRLKWLLGRLTSFWR